MKILEDIETVLTPGSLYLMWSRLRTVFRFHSNPFFCLFFGYFSLCIMLYASLRLTSFIVSDVETHISNYIEKKKIISMRILSDKKLIWIAFLLKTLDNLSLLFLSLFAMSLFSLFSPPHKLLTLKHCLDLDQKKVS